MWKYKVRLSKEKVYRGMVLNDKLAWFPYSWGSCRYPPQLGNPWAFP